MTDDLDETTLDEGEIPEPPKIFGRGEVPVPPPGEILIPPLDFVAPEGEIPIPPA